MSNRYPLKFNPALPPSQHMTDGGAEPNAYLAGPMRGYEMHNFPAFFDAALTLRYHGWGIENPAEYDIAAGVDPSKEEKAWPITVKEMLRTDFRLILERCNAVILLPGWAESKGATMECAIAHNIGLPVFELVPQVVGGGLRLVRMRIDEINIQFLVEDIVPATIDPFENVERAGL
tara:strand:+ start:386 stop:913 length:528 start_codon:yes stop_codon:yes gene_type:complete